MEKRLEAGWGQRIAWCVLVAASAGLLSWMPFLVVGIRRGRRGDWITFGAFLVAMIAMVPWAIVSSDGPGDPGLGAVAIVVIVTAVVMLLFTVFDKPGTKDDAVTVAQPQGGQFLQ